MKILVILFIYIFAGLGAWAKTNHKAVTKAAVASSSPANRNTKLGTNFNFEGHAVNGKIQAPFESLAVVENEKSIDDLIGVRKDFRDRSRKAKELR